MCDTNIFIHYFNKDEKTAKDLDEIGIDNIIIPAVSVMELYRGMSNKQQLQEMVKKIKRYAVLDMNENVSALALEYIKNYRLSHDMKIPDAFIAASSVTFDLPLFTYNTKDFRFIPGIKLHKSKQ